MPSAFGQASMTSIRGPKDICGMPETQPAISERSSTIPTFAAGNFPFLSPLEIIRAISRKSSRFSGLRRSDNHRMKPTLIVEGTND